ncbi:hypothetical protein JL193_07965 [Polaribacter batillariae]|uniref:Uncharacterized protein n=1 Tax=Polaribacter batillariae TaxID=2808900 RepID=A0ABX7SY78_9FLAO|nr:hypothetical protein [Polaribacter batillariae]QTD39161.1 hypothetical protein JL193_07965 [Polaribacter batillariae]
MFLQILPPDSIATTENFLDIQLILVIAGLALSVFLILKLSKFLSKIKISKTTKKPSYTS